MEIDLLPFFVVPEEIVEWRFFLSNLLTYVQKLLALSLVKIFLHSKGIFQRFSGVWHRDQRITTLFKVSSKAVTKSLTSKDLQNSVKRKRHFLSWDITDSIKYAA